MKSQVHPLQTSGSHVQSAHGFTPHVHIDHKSHDSAILTLFSVAIAYNIVSGLYSLHVKGAPPDQFEQKLGRGSDRYNDDIHES